jgi:hypothetical protein
MARQRNNIYAVAADAVDLALDTAGTIGTVVGGIAHMIGIGNGQEKPDQQEQREADDAASRVATSLSEEAHAVQPRHKAKAHNKRVGKTRSAAATSARKLAPRRATRKAA